jgi:hypothetical protein
MSMARPLMPAVRCAALVVAVCAVAWNARRAAAAAPQPAAERHLVILPQQVELRGPEARARLIVGWHEAQRYVGPAPAGTSLESSDPQVVRVDQGVLVPVGNGRASIVARTGDHTAQCDVTVRDLEAPFTWSFRNQVQSVLTRLGCNSGACHGAALGKKGFRLSLRGYDAQGDYLSITRHNRGRRIVPSDPGRSLLLLKPTAAVPHGGGFRLDVGSLEYRVLAEWIAAGAPPPQPSDPHLLRLEVFPPQAFLRPGDEQPLVVRAAFSDGRTEDVTRWVKFASTHDAVAQVSDAGLVQVRAAGAGAVTAWYLSQIAVVPIVVPFDQQVDPSAWDEAPRANLIDELVLARLRDLNLPPSPPADDATFLRRAYLDTIGALPTVEETRQFLADTRPDKRQRLIEHLLSRPEFVDYWAYKWSDLLLVNSEKLRPPAMWAYYRWIRRHVESGTPWDAMVGELLTAQGDTLHQGAANFYVLHPDPQDLAETTSQAFLGLSIGCAKCHNHPLEKWTNDQYFAMANLFARVRTKEAAGDGNKSVFEADSGDVASPLTGVPQPPQPLEGPAMALDDPASRRQHLARWLTAADNAYFARAIVNRVWANFLGVGLVEPVDDLRASNPASNEALLAALADYLVQHKYDLNALMRLILQSQTYQRSSEPLPENVADERFYSRYYPRRLMAEVLLDALSDVTGAPTRFPGYPPSWRALQLPDANVESYFLKSFGRPQRILTCECERSDEPSMVQVLHLANGDTVNGKLQAKGNRIDRLLAAGASDEQIIEELYLAALCRPPTPQQTQRLAAVLREAAADAAQRREAIEDLFWSVLSSRDFLFAH